MPAEPLGSTGTSSEIAGRLAAERCVSALLALTCVVVNTLGARIRAARVTTRKRRGRQPGQIRQLRPKPRVLRRDRLPNPRPSGMPVAMLMTALPA